MKTVLTFLTIIFLSAGVAPSKEQAGASITPYTYSNGLATFTISQYKFGNCYYLGTIRGGNNDILTHQGDCPNLIHNYNTGSLTE